MLFWSDGGPTDLANLILVCSRHHTLIHQQGFLLVLEPDRTLTVHTADGARIEHHPALPWQPAEDLPADEITPGTLPSQWTGERMDLGYVVSVMLQHAATHCRRSVARASCVALLDPAESGKGTSPPPCLGTQTGNDLLSSALMLRNAGVSQHQDGEQKIGEAGDTPTFRAFGNAPSNRWRASMPGIGFPKSSGANSARGEAMSTLENRPNTALLVVDVQNGVVAEAHERDAVVANLATLVETARREQVPVIWVQHNDEDLVKGSESWRIVPELTPDVAEPLVDKSFGDSFEETSLESVLSGLRVGRLVIAGAQTDACITSTLHGAFVRGYDVTLVSDAHTTEDSTKWGAPPPDQVITFTNLFWEYHSAPGRTAGAVETKAVDFAGS